ncbi:MAG: molybdopterin molybdotransferase MoeA, partial [Anaerolineae bacterium]|nr:molybdopterin molybdotransferase MoeA [Anaerolineae bacterium]
MYSVDQALERILAAFDRLPAEHVALDDALGRTLAADVRASENLPPFANSSMDGYAVRAEDVAHADRNHGVRLRVVADIPAGTYSARAIGTGEAARIMTGAPMPPGADAVVPVEQTDSPPERFQPGQAAPPSVQILAAPSPGAYVRQAGEDVRAGQVVLDAGRVLRAADLGVLAGLGMAGVDVVRRPRVAIISTGDELLEINEPLAPGK